MEVHTTTITITTQINNIIVITCLFYLQMMNDKKHSQFRNLHYHQLVWKLNLVVIVLAVNRL